MKETSVLYDYLKAYFDFFIKENILDYSFANARELVKKYEKYPIDHFRIMFLKIKEQLDEIDEGINEAVAAKEKMSKKINPDANE